MKSLSCKILKFQFFVFFIEIILKYKQFFRNIDKDDNNLIAFITLFVESRSKKFFYGIIVENRSEENSQKINHQ